MYKTIESLQGALIGLHIRKDITGRENEAIIQLIEQRFALHGPLRLLVIHEAPPGMLGAETLYENLRFAKLTSDKLSKMAVIGKHEWENTWIGLFGLFGGIQTHYFSRSNYEAALQWLSTQP